MEGPDLGTVINQIYYWLDVFQTPIIFLIAAGAAGSAIGIILRGLLGSGEE